MQNIYFHLNLHEAPTPRRRLRGEGEANTSRLRPLEPCSPLGKKGEQGLVMGSAQFGVSLHP